MAAEDPFEQFKGKYESELAKLGTFNLAVVGATGAGKSTLINAIFRANVAEVGNGRPVTAHITRLERPGVPLAIYDTKGVELGDAADAVIAEFRQIIEAKRAGGVREQIHAVWYCIRSHDKRIEDFQIALIRSFVDQGLPVMVVLTQCLGPEDEEALEFARVVEAQGLPTSPGPAPFLTLALERRISSSVTMMPFGLQELLDATFDVVPEAARDALINAERIDLERKVKRARGELAGFAATAAGIGATPIPFADAALLVPVQLGMLARICVIFGVEIKKETMLGLVASAAGTGGATAAGRYVATSLLKFVPGGNVVGGAIRAGTAAALTTALGEAYVQVCREIVRREFAGERPLAQDEIKDMVLARFREWAKKLK